MSGIGFSLFLCLTVFVHYLPTCESSRLLAVSTLYRHGSRGPIKLYKNDPYQKRAEEIWPEGFQQLTKIGKIQEYELGKWLRSHYKGFVPEKYNPKFIKVMSSNVDRCLMSAAANLAGLFPPNNKEMWNKNLLWQPIPIHTIPEEEDIVLAIMKPCPKHQQLYEDVLKSKQYKKFMDDGQHIMKYVEKHSGENATDLAELALVHDALFVESYFGLKLPEWTNKVFPNLTSPLFVSSLKLPVSTFNLARLRAGPLINLLSSYFEKVLSDPKDSQKFLMLSAHDHTIVYLMNALGSFDDTWPEYGTTMMLELRSRKNEEFINIFYKNSTGLLPITIKNCEFDCNFKKFKKITGLLRITPENWNKECFNV